MTKNVTTVADDIENTLSGLTSHEPLTDERLATLGFDVAQCTKTAMERIIGAPKVRAERVLYASEVGKPCTRQIWYNIHGSKIGMVPEVLPGFTRMKFLYGDYIEALALFLAELSGHKVANKQERLTISLGDWTISGKQDAEIDDEIVDVKSTSARMFDRLKGIDFEGTDDWGYVEQIRTYAAAKAKKKAYLLLVHKELGKLALPEFSATYPLVHSGTPIETKLRLLEGAVPPPRPATGRLKEHTKGNMALAAMCSYCPFKRECYKDSNGGRGLRTFMYSTGPVFMTAVTGNTPKVLEVREYGT